MKDTPFDKNEHPLPDSFSTPGIGLWIIKRLMWVIKLNSSSFLFILFVNIHSQQKQFSRSAHQMSTVSSPQRMTCRIFKELQFPCGCGYTLEICCKFTTKHLCYDVNYIDLRAFYILFLLGKVYCAIAKKK